jgi:two-component system response regulator MprA
MQSTRVLIVEDELPLANLLQQAFTQEGMHVAHARDGIDCMNMVASFQPDVVIMDIMMPRLDGVDATRLIRRNRNYAGTIIVALTARCDADTRDNMRQAGADLFMRKPFVISRLVARVQELLVERSRLG